MYKILSQSQIYVSLAICINTLCMDEPQKQLGLSQLASSVGNKLLEGLENSFLVPSMAILLHEAYTMHVVI